MQEEPKHLSPKLHSAHPKHQDNAREILRADDSQWQIIEKIIDSKRKHKHGLRVIINAILYINYTGIQWRNLENEYPPCQSVFLSFYSVEASWYLGANLGFLRVASRKNMRRAASPSLLAIDSQSVKTVQFISAGIGVNGHKNINGRKRTILVDKLRHPFAFKVTGANISDNEAGLLALESLQGKVARLEK